MKYEHIKTLKESSFRQATGVLPSTFAEMMKVLKEEYERIHTKPNQRSGRERKLSIEDNLLMMLEYYKEYRTFECIGASYGLTNSTVSKAIMWVEETLLKSGIFNLPGKKVLLDREAELEIVVVDTTEIPIERPKRGQKQYYSGKKNGTH
jgi:hypothetical protein